MRPVQCHPDSLTKDSLEVILTREFLEVIILSLDVY